MSPKFDDKSVVQSGSESAAHSLDAARARIRAAYDPNLVRDAGERLTELLSNHLRRVQNSETVVLPWIDPRENVRAARPCAPFPAATDPASGSVATSAEIAPHFSRLVETMLSHGINLHDPRYVGHQVPPPIPLSGLFEAEGATTNQPMAVNEMGPWATAACRWHL